MAHSDLSPDVEVLGLLVGARLSLMVPSKIDFSRRQPCSAYRCGRTSVLDELVPDIDGTGRGEWMFWCEEHKPRSQITVSEARQMALDILHKAEEGRAVVDEEEAKRGIQYV